MKYKIEDIKGRAMAYISSHVDSEEHAERSFEILYKYNDIWSEFIYFIRTGKFVNEINLPATIVRGYSAYQLSKWPFACAYHIPFQVLSLMRQKMLSENFFTMLRASEHIEDDMLRMVGKYDNHINLTSALGNYIKDKTAANLCTVCRAIGNMDLYYISPTYSDCEGTLIDTKERRVYIKIYTKEACERVAKRKNIPILKSYSNTRAGLSPIKFNDIYKIKHDHTYLMLVYIGEDGQEKNIKLTHDYIYDGKVPCKIKRIDDDTFIEFASDYALYHESLPLRKFGLSGFYRENLNHL